MQSSFLKAIQNHGKGFVIINKDQVRYSYQKNTLLSDNLGTKSLSEYVNAFFDIGVDFRSYSLGNDAVLIIIGDLERSLDEYELLENLARKLEINVDKQTMESLFGDVIHKDDDNISDDPYVKQTNELAERFSEIKNNLTVAEGKTLKEFEKKLKKSFDQCRNILHIQFIEKFDAPGLGMMPTDSKENKFNETKTNLLTNLEQIITLLEKNQDIVKNRNVANKSEVNRIAEQLRIMNLIVIELKTIFEKSN